MQYILMNAAYIWLFFGGFLIALEAMTVPGMGLFLAGLGALATGIMIGLGLLESHHLILQCISFFSFTCIFALILWKPLIKFRMKSRNDRTSFHDMIGASGVVGGTGLKRGETGQVIWSGTIMNAELDHSVSNDFLSVGTHVRIKSVSGTTLKVTLKQP